MVASLKKNALIVKYKAKEKKNIQIFKNL